MQLPYLHQLQYTTGVYNLQPAGQMQYNKVDFYASHIVDSLCETKARPAV